MNKYQLKDALMEIFKSKDTILCACVNSECVYYFGEKCQLKDITIDKTGQCIHWKWQEQNKKAPPMVRPIKRGK